MSKPFKHTIAPHLDKLWVIVPLSNTQRYRSRYDLFREFSSRYQDKVNLFTVEMALGDRPFEFTHAGDSKSLQLRSTDEIWSKERMINLAIERLPRDWQYVAWVDGDVEFVRNDWAEEVCHQLQHYQVIQMFQSAVDLGPDGEVMKSYNGFVHSWQQGLPRPEAGSRSTAPWHPGFAWAARREAVDSLGGLFDTAILGSGDHHMAWSLLGDVTYMLPGGISSGYMRRLLEWQDRATRHIRQNIGCMPGTILHHFHGKKSDRRYGSRWDILTKHGFNPDSDLRRDWQGLYALSDQGTRLRNDIRDYFAARNEDSVDL